MQRPSQFIPPPCPECRFAGGFCDKTVRSGKDKLFRGSKPVAKTRSIRNADSGIKGFILDKSTQLSTLRSSVVSQERGCGCSLKGNMRM